MWEVWLWAALCSGLVLSAPHLGESTELALLLVHESPQHSPLVLRRITPKSVFLAPTFTSCSEGYRQDSMGRCVKVVKINQEAQWAFFLQKLNSMYALPAEPPKRDTAPLHFPIPIEDEPTTAEPTTTGASTLEPTMTPFMIVVPNTTLPVDTTETTTTEGTTTTVSTEDTVAPSTVASSTVPPSTIYTEGTTGTTGGTTAVETSTMTTSAKCEDCQDAEETVVTETFAPVKSTVRFPGFIDQRMRPSSASSYVRFPESYSSAVVSPYWWAHNWGKSQPVWPQKTHHRPPYNPPWPASY